MSSILFHDGNRALQDEFGSRALADRLEQRLMRTAFTDDDRSFIESAIYFFLATADTNGRPDCSFKGGAPGFVRGHKAVRMKRLVLGNTRKGSWRAPLSAPSPSTSSPRR